MASIVQRGKSFSIVYYVNGKPRWETCKTEEEAKKRKLEVEYKQSKGTFVAPSKMTVEDLMKRFISTYGRSKWGFSAYEANVGLINNYIIPKIGSWSLTNCTTRKMTVFFSELGDQEAVQRPGRKVPPSLISDRNIYEIYGLLNIAFRLAVEWEELGKNPLTKSMKPASHRGKRNTWDEETAKKAVSMCESMRLLLFIHLALAGSMRVGEISGLQWPKVFFNLQNDFEDSYVNIDVQLSRINRKAYLELVRKKDQIKLIFPEVYLDKKYKTMLVLKTPKTASSVRTVYIPKTTAKLLYKWKKMQEDLKGTLGDEYQDFGLVMTLDNGRPIESRIIGLELDDFIKKHNLPDVDFHSLRHTSTSVKLVITQGDIKSVQGDNGQAQAKMVTDTYAEIYDGRRKENAKKFDKEFFKEESPANYPEEVLEQIFMTLLKNPNAEKVFARTVEKIRSTSISKAS